MSVIIATYNRRALLADVLQALRCQTIPSERFEVIVVDDGSEDGTAEWFDKQFIRMQCRLVRQANQGSSSARNAGILAARGEILVFLDDDFIPGPTLLEEHLKSHDAEKHIAVIGPAPSLTYYPQPWIAWQQATMERDYAAMADGTLEPSFREFWTGNCSVERSHLVAAGGFDPSLRLYHDVELGFRLMTHGIRFRFNTSATGLHHSAHSLDEWCKINGDYAQFSVRLFGQLGQDKMVELLASDWARRHRLTRWLVRMTVGHRRRVAFATAALKAGIRVGTIAPMSKYSYAVCAALANLLYWDGVAQELGSGASTCAMLEGRERSIGTGNRPGLIAP